MICCENIVKIFLQQILVNNKLLLLLLLLLWGPIDPICSNCIGKGWVQYLVSYVQTAKEWAGPNIQYEDKRVFEDDQQRKKWKLHSEKEVKNACEGFDRVRGQLSPRSFCPRWPVDLSVP